MCFQKSLRRFLLVGFLSVIALSNQASAINPGEIAPEFSLLSADNKLLSLTDYSGKVVYLDFWATWCAPCRETLPWMNLLQSKFNKDSFRVLAVNLDQNSEKAKQLIKELGLTITVMYDPEGKVAKLFKLPAMPTSFLINQKGELVRSYLGFRNGDSESIEAAIRELLQKGA